LTDSVIHGSTIYSVNWLPDGKYLAVGGSTASDVAIRTYSFDGSSLMLIDSVIHGSTIYSVNWSPDGKYLAVGGAPGTNNYQVRAYSFDGSSLMLEDSVTHGNHILSVDWSSGGRYLAVGGNTGTDNYQIRVYAMMNAPTNCILRGNIASNSTGDLTIGYGIAAGGDNLFLANTGYANDANFSYGVMPFVAGTLSNPNVIDNLWMP